MSPDERDETIERLTTLLLEAVEGLEETYSDGDEWSQVDGWLSLAHRAIEDVNRDRFVRGLRKPKAEGQWNRWANLSECLRGQSEEIGYALANLRETLGRDQFADALTGSDNSRGTAPVEHLVYGDVEKFQRAVERLCRTPKKVSA